MTETKATAIPPMFQAYTKRRGPLSTETKPKDGDCRPECEPASTGRPVTRRYHVDGCPNDPPRRERKSMTLGEAAWGPGGCYED